MRDIEKVIEIAVECCQECDCCDRARDRALERLRAEGFTASEVGEALPVINKIVRAELDPDADPTRQTIEDMIYE